MPDHNCGNHCPRVAKGQDCDKCFDECGYIGPGFATEKYVSHIARYDSQFKIRGYRLIELRDATSTTQTSKVDGWEGCDVGDWSKSKYCNETKCFMRLPCGPTTKCSKHSLSAFVVTPEDRLTDTARRFLSRREAKRIKREQCLNPKGIDITGWPTTRVPLYKEIVRLTDDQVIELAEKLDEETLCILNKSTKEFFTNRYCAALAAIIS